MNSIPIASGNDLRNAVGEEPPGTHVHLTFLRSGRRLVVSAKLAALNQTVAQANIPGSQENSGPLAGLRTGAIPQSDPEYGKLSGVYVASVAPDSDAAQAGLQQGDIILKADRKPVLTPSQLQNAVNANSAGRPVLLRVARDNAILFLALG
jgi:serine protease Do